MATKDDKIDAFKEAEKFLMNGWNPEDCTLDGYLTICQDIKGILEELKKAESNNLSDEQFKKERLIAATQILALLP